MPSYNLIIRSVELTKNCFPLLLNWIDFIGAVDTLKWYNIFFLKTFLILLIKF